MLPFGQATVLNSLVEDYEVRTRGSCLWEQPGLRGDDGIPWNTPLAQSKDEPLPSRPVTVVSGWAPPWCTSRAQTGLPVPYHEMRTTHTPRRARPIDSGNNAPAEHLHTEATGSL